MTFNPVTYLKESRAELEKVIWPTPRATTRLTLVVIFVSVVIGSYIASLDFIFTKVAERIIK